MPHPFPPYISQRVGQSKKLTTSCVLLTFPSSYKLCVLSPFTCRCSARNSFFTFSFIFSNFFSTFVIASFLFSSVSVSFISIAFSKVFTFSNARRYFSSFDMSTIYIIAILVLVVRSFLFLLLTNFILSHQLYALSI